MSVIDKKQGAIKLSEVFTDTAQAALGTPVGEDALSVVAQIQQLALDSFLKQGIQSFSTGRLKWTGSLISFNEDTRNNDLYFRVLQTDNDTVRTVDIVLRAAGANSNTRFSTLPLANNELLYIELSKSALLSAPGGVLEIENAVSGSSLATGMTLRKVALSQGTGMPMITSLLTGNGSSLFIPVAFRYDWTDGATNFQDLMWVMPGERWEIDTSTYIGTSVAKSTGGAVLNFIETSGIGWDAEVGSAGINSYNDSSAVPVDGTGGTISPNWAFGVTTNTAEILSGKASFYIEKTGSTNLQGHGISFDIKIDRGYRSRYVVFKALFSIVSGIFNPGDVKGYVIADPTGTPQLLSVQNNSIGAGIGEMNATFYPLLNVDTYRVCFHLTTNSVNNFRLILDDLKINPVFFVTADAFGSVAPAGVITSYGGTGDPQGWMICDGRSLNRSAYPELFAAIGTAFGSAGALVFNLPDLRGKFVRGVNAGSGNDPDAAGRTAATGGNSGDAVGSLQSGQVQSHSHPIATDTRWNFGYPGVVTAASPPGIQAGVSTTLGAGGSETRPVNVNANFIIKLYPDVKNTVLSSASVSYAANSNATPSASDLVAFSGRMEGELIPALAINAANSTRRVQYNGQIAPTDHLKLQVDFGSGGRIWADAHSRFARTDVAPPAVIASAVNLSNQLVVPSVADIYVGMPIVGTGFTLGTLVTAVNPISSSVTLSNASSADTTDAVYYFGAMTFGMWLEPVPGSLQQLDIFFGGGGATQSGSAWSNFSGWRWRVVKASSDISIQAQIKDDAGSIKMFGGGTAPNGWLPCDGRSLLRTAYPELFSAIGTRWGARNANEFNVPDSRGVFFRGAMTQTDVVVPFSAVNASTDVISAPAHGFNRSGFMIQFLSGSPPGNISNGGVYWVIVVDDNNIKLANSMANAIAGVAIDITSQGAGNHTLTQFIDPDNAGRIAEATGGANVWQNDQLRSHIHQINRYGAGDNGGLLGGNLAGPLGGTQPTQATGGNETRPVNVAVLFMIKT